jgi:hypothetical protein
MLAALTARVMAIEPNLGIFITTFLDTVEAEDIFQVTVLPSA